MLDVPLADSFEMSAGFGVSTSYFSSVSGITLLLSLLTMEEASPIPEFGLLQEDSFESLELAFRLHALSKMWIFASLAFYTVYPTL